MSRILRKLAAGVKDEGQGSQAQNGYEGNLAVQIDTNGKADPIRRITAVQPLDGTERPRAGGLLITRIASVMTIAWRW